ncbi:MAG: efflux RND transporter periplasmic adaptor subunit [bacterium]|nr:efflux RND transporter periplasmic adaptor subunit [bacterium]
MLAKPEKRLIPPGLAALAAAWIVALVAACDREPPPAEPVLRPVRYQEVVAAGGKRTRTFSGVARAGTESRLSFRVAGTVERINVTVGQEVTAGTVLAQLDAKDCRLQVREAEAGVAQAEAALRNAEAEYDRVRELYENQNASKSQLDGARAQAESARAQVEGARNRLALARSQLGYTTLRSPVAGSVAEVPVEVNENVQAGRMVALLTSGSRSDVEVGVPEVLISQIREGDAVEVTFDALPGESFAAVVTEVGVATTGAAATFPVTVRLSRSESGLRSGMAAEVAFRFANGETGERMVVPPVAVGEDRQGRFVFVVEDRGDGTAVVHRRPVEVGELTTGGLEVSSGLEDGEIIATAGVRRLTDGLAVKLLRADS